MPVVVADDEQELYKKLSVSVTLSEFMIELFKNELPLVNCIVMLSNFIERF